jgi:glycosyltransferase involved in cell wall biosynthesis
MNFSIIIPTCNRSAALYNALFSLSKNKYDKNKIEVIVVDNSTLEKEVTKTKEVTNSVSKWFKTNYFYNKIGGPSPARNLGILKAKYKHLIFIDDDALLPLNFLTLYRLAWVRNKNVSMIGGKVIPKFKFKRPDFLSPDFKWIFAHLDLGNKTLELKYPEHIYSANMSIYLDHKKVIFNEILGKRYFLNYCLFGEDIELCYRYQLENKKIIYDPKIIVYNVADIERNSKIYYWKRIINSGIERHIIDRELKNVYSKYIEYTQKYILTDFKKQFLGKEDKSVLKEKIAYFLGYYLISNLFIAYHKLISR